jgi:hypothetical protein
MHSYDTGYQTGSVSYKMTSINGGATSLSFTSNNWPILHFKSEEDKHIGMLSEGFGSDQSTVAKKGSTMALEDISLWLPGSRHTVSSTPTKACD